MKGLTNTVRDEVQTQKKPLVSDLIFASIDGAEGRTRTDMYLYG